MVVVDRENDVTCRARKRKFPQSTDRGIAGRADNLRKRRANRRQIAAALLCVGAFVPVFSPAHGACSFESSREGRVGEISDATTFRLTDGQEVRLAGIIAPSARAPDRAALTALLQNRDVTLRSASAKPDRYGRLVALAYVTGAAEPVQMSLLDQGDALAAGDMGTSEPHLDCLRDLLAHEAAARRTRRGYWADPSAIKNAERADDISPWIGQFVVAEGKIASVREAGATIYVNFGRRWTRDFAVTISRRMVRGFEAAGMSPKTLENRVVRVRGWVEQRTGPRIEALGPGQIEVVR
jgi:endonuclease YncB( thermonuclease family)